jgi:hypothetical protein
MGPSGAGSAFEDPSLPYRSLRDRSRERIYRVAPADGRLDAILDLSKATPAQLVAALGHGNMLWRTQAQVQILKRTTLQADKDAMETLLLNACKNSWARDEVGIDGFALHALWTAEGLGLLRDHAATWDPVLKAMLAHPSYAVRMNVAKAMPRTAASAAAIRDQKLLADNNPHVRLWAMMALADMPKTDGLAIYAAYHNLDAYSKTAFDKAAAGAGLAESATKPDTLVQHAVQPAVAVRGAGALPTRAHLRFGRIRGGEWQPFPEGGIGAGALTVYDLQGKAVAAAGFDGRAWSNPVRGLTQSTYLFAFRGRDGSVLQGKIQGL